MTEDRPTAQDYADIFDVNKTGDRILDDLVIRFGGPKGKSAGIDRILDAHELVGQRRVLDFIVNMINRANGVQVDPPQEEP